MKKMKRLVALALSVVMVLAMSVFASAATVSVNEDLKDHTFEAYQIFKGTQSAGSTELGDVEWGSGIKSGEFLDALKADETIGSIFASCTNAKDVATALAANESTAETVAKIAFSYKNGVGTELNEGDNDLPSGYYLIVDKTSMTKPDGSKDDALNAALLQVTGNITINKKTDKPSVEKKVKENEKYQGDGTYETGYNDTADYNIGDMVPFELIGTVPDMSQYKTYKYAFHDTLSTAFDNVAVGDIKVYVADNKAGKNEKDITDSFNIVSDEHEITVSTDNLKDIDGVSKDKYIIVKYSAKLNDTAAIGQGTVGDTGLGNINKVHLTYSNNPNQGGEGEVGETPDDVVIVFTYKLVTKKVDGENNNPLKNVTFKLYRVNNGKQEWAKVDLTSNKLTEWTETEEDGTELKSGEDGKFTVIGLDAGTYWIQEIAALPGYNKMEDAKVEIKANTSNGQSGNGQTTELTELEVNVNDAEKDTKIEDPAPGQVDITIENNKGSQLPSTGGIGTTIFYIVGGILMVGAAVLLITKRRAEN